MKCWLNCKNLEDSKTPNLHRFGISFCSDSEDKASVVRQTDCILFSFFRARLTLDKMSVAVAVQMNGLGA